MPKYEAALSHYEKFAFTNGAWTREVYRRGSGPAVIVVHDISGLHPLMIRFADQVAAAGGAVRRSRASCVARLCLPSIVGALSVRREFNAWSLGKSSPIVEWLRAPARKAHAECGGKRQASLPRRRPLDDRAAL